MQNDERKISYAFAYLHNSLITNDRFLEKEESFSYKIHQAAAVRY